MFAASPLATLVNDELNTAGIEERGVPKFNEVSGHDRTLWWASILLGGFRDGKSTDPGIGKVLHEPNPILVIDVVGGENCWHFRHTLLQLIQVLDLEVLEGGVGLCSIGRSAKPFRRR
jgi:hypothetical protein